ncbi:TPA: hypothetical protein ACF3LB_002238 [Enterobacter hormaechei]|uniref:hypothetical protein n=1 Tax=Enterobacter sp. DTU_2021_1002640_1_SI_PRY_ASU_LCPMC_013 TaxID=3077940 RepID=UPI001A141C91|nr:hypothetical protein [Enterobacter sp. DTU_2021_1002640_1_SI_PRY_ASU_LCPMC_013]EGQ5291490.1 hypothetical protein [Enterobacter hormaechei]WNU99843.1 hypothetical protein RS584_19520 [Enterobacter sp. DTU_2021_1002640_1_SI_PRY_ASU_LCPMC_013]
MRYIDKALILITLLWSPSILWATDSYFSCNTSKGTASLTAVGERLIYEMNSHHGNKFQYISEESIHSEFLYNHYSRFQTDYLSISFVQSGYKYAVFSNYDNGNSARGVSVIDMRTKKEYVYDCKDYKVDRLSDLAKKLECDTNNALGC